MLEGFKMNCYPLNRTIRVSIRLPKDYNQTGRYYPAVYFLDGQNLYNESESYTGRVIDLEKVIEKLEQEEKEVIYIGIAGASNPEKRIVEYENTVLADFILNSIHPFLKSRYRMNNYIYSCGWNQAVLNALALNQTESFKGAILLSPIGDFTLFHHLNIQKNNLYYITYTPTTEEMASHIKTLLPNCEFIQENTPDELPSKEQLYQALSYLIL